MTKEEAHHQAEAVASAMGITSTLCAGRKAIFFRYKSHRMIAKSSRRSRLPAAFTKARSIASKQLGRPDKEPVRANNAAVTGTAFRKTDAGAAQAIEAAMGKAGKSGA